jgi:hypothetical protein
MRIDDSEFRSLVHGATSRLDLWLRILRADDVRRMAEVGVWKGDFAKDILTQRPEIERYTMIDPWANLPDWNKPWNVDARTFDDVHAEAMEKTAFAKEKIHVLRGRTSDVAHEIPDGSLDLAYIDGDHTLRGITIDLIRLLPKIRQGGLIGGDDFTANPWQHDARFEPTLVCPFAIFFAEAMDLPVVALPFDQFVIENRADASFSFIDTTGSYGDISLNKLPPRRWAARVKGALKGLGGGS